MKELENIQGKLMTNPSDFGLWLLDQSLPKKIHIGNLGQKVHWAQRAKKEWFTLGDKNTKTFQLAATIVKEKIIFGKF